MTEGSLFARKELSNWSDLYKAIAKVINPFSHLYPNIVKWNADQVLIMSSFAQPEQLMWMTRTKVIICWNLKSSVLFLPVIVCETVHAQANCMQCIINDELFDKVWILWFFCCCCKYNYSALIIKHSFCSFRYKSVNTTRVWFSNYKL